MFSREPVFLHSLLAFDSLTPLCKSLGHPPPPCCGRAFSWDQSWLQSELPSSLWPSPRDVCCQGSQLSTCRGAGASSGSQDAGVAWSHIGLGENHSPTLI